MISKPESDPNFFANFKPLQSKRILVVEDDISTRDLFKFIFEEAGAQVIAVLSIKEAIEVLQNLQPDVLVSNMKMPDGDGFALIETVRESEVGKTVPALLVTGLPEWEYGPKARRLGYEKYLTKPIDPEKLVEEVCHLVKKGVNCSLTADED
ncbi:response regulator [Phormidium sp. CCY1219]|uniref:response regulator n=1 Tax=Phormidium sp. CCY1219 TaxID=2886104 RepID=UPI002D1E7740|nr:response regulator [Phormidium sp. CCY1219]MEB3830379.1 response regulator [Phormidium sp. CCY1219]